MLPGLVALAEGDFGWASQQGYPAFLAHFGDLELQLLIASQGAQAAQRARKGRLLLYADFEKEKKTSI